MQSNKIIVIISILLSLLIIALFINFFVIPRGKETKKPEMTFTEPAPLKETAKKPDEPGKTYGIPDFPPLNDSDQFVREYLKKTLKPSSLEAWLNQDDLIRRFVATVDNIASGENPMGNLKFLAPEKPFQIRKENDRLIPDPGNYSRFDKIVNIFAETNTETVISLFQELKPLMNQAYAEMGYPEKRFDDTLMQAIDILLKTPMSRFPVYLEKKVLTYAFVDPDLEALSPAQKLLIRAGQENMQKIKEKLYQLKGKLNFTVNTP